ncbi:hypothetical protein [Halobacillus sp. KGW1]|uniref:DUF3892 domain-containing protein n=1 Tax=Halobacillus sp. KGW1 TaxID=1793726 RepID=UPI0007832D38|nr:hypothetical protein [Halobacillus sp. KGW1]
MPKRKNVKVTQENDSGLNQKFQVGNRELTRGQFADEIEQGKHPGYHNAKMNGKRIPRSNPDRKKKNNLE